MSDETIEDYLGAFLIEEMMPMPYFTLLYLAVLSQLHRAVLKHKKAEGLPLTFEKTVERRRVHWPTDLVHYFEPLEPNFKQMRVSAADDVRLELSKFIHTVSQSFLNDLRLLLEMSEEDDIGALRLMQTLVDATATPIFFESVLRTKEPLSYFAILTKSADSSRAIALRKITEFAEQAVTFLATKLGLSDLTSADVPGVSISDENLLKTRFVGRAPPPADVHEPGFYYLIRQARGHRTKDPKREGIVVRDLLWIRPGPTSFNGIWGNPEKFGSRVGYYFSTIDEQVFEITFIVHRNRVLMIDAIAYLDDFKTKSLCLYMPRVEGDGFSLGSMIGIVETDPIPPRTGAWTVVAMRADIQREERENLVDDLSVFGDAMAQIEDRKEYDRRIVNAVRLIEERGLIGVLFSKSALEAAEEHNSDASQNKELARLRARDGAFSRMFRGWSTYDGNGPDARVESLVNEIKVGTPNAEARMRGVLKELIEDEERHALTPPAAERRNQKGERTALDEDIHILSSREHVPSYNEFMSAKAAGE